MEPKYQIEQKEFSEMLRRSIFIILDGRIIFNGQKLDLPALSDEIAKSVERLYEIKDKAFWKGESFMEALVKDSKQEVENALKKFN